jgi:hypothetical protein
MLLERFHFRFHVPFTFPRFIALFLVIIYIVVKYIFRTIEVESYFINFTLGVLPNFLAAVGIPMFGLWNYHKLKLEEIQKNHKRMPYFLAFLGLVFISEEIFPFFGNSKVFDYWDMLSSAFGLILFHSYYNHLYRRALIANSD